MPLLSDNIDKINWPMLCGNPNDAAVGLLLENRDKINWIKLSQNTNDRAVSMLLETPGNIYMDEFYKNPNDMAVDFLLAREEKAIAYASTNMYFLYQNTLYQNTNPRILNFFEKTQKKGNWHKPFHFSLREGFISYKSLKDIAIEFAKEYNSGLPASQHWWMILSKNPCDEALDLLEENQENINWGMLSGNPSDRALDLIEANPGKIEWRTLSNNTNDRALVLLERNRDKISWEYLSSNSNDRAISLLEENPDKIAWEFLSMNPSDLLWYQTEYTLK